MTYDNASNFQTRTLETVISVTKEEEMVKNCNKQVKQVKQVKLVKQVKWKNEVACVSNVRVSTQDAERPANLESHWTLVFHFSLFLAFPYQTHSVHLTSAME